MDIKDFEEIFHEITNDKEKEEEYGKELTKEEKEIAKQNDDFEQGKATFNEKVYPWTDLGKEEFEDEKEGLKIPPGKDRFGFFVFCFSTV